jgi:hypothetical protein
VSAAVTIRADPALVWAELTDWSGQRRWIPFTTVRVSGQCSGIGVRAEALSGVWLGTVPIGLLDRFVVTDWAPPDHLDHRQSGSSRLEVLHLGPYFTGPGAFTVSPVAGGSRVECVEAIDLPGGRAVDAAVRLLLPLVTRGLAHSLGRLAAICQD